MSRKITIIAKDTNNKEVKTSLTSANPNATPATLKNCATSLNSLTTNTYINSLCTDVTELDEITTDLDKATR